MCTVRQQKKKKKSRQTRACHRRAVNNVSGGVRERERGSEKKSKTTIRKSIRPMYKSRMRVMDLFGQSVVARSIRI